MRKKVLIITYYWPPAGGSGVQRWVKFSKYLRDYGWEPVIFTAEDGDYPVLDPQLQQELPQSIGVIREPIREPYTLYKKWMGKSKNDKLEGNFLSQGKKLSFRDKIAVWIRGNFFIPDAKMWWIRPSVRRIIEYLKNNPVEAIISTGPPHTCHLIAYGVHRRYHLPWIVDYRDPWTQIDYFDDLQLTSWAENQHKKLEKRVLDACSAIVTVGKTMAEDLNTITQNRKVVITNGYDETDRNTHPEATDKEFSIVYIGTMNDSRNPESLWKAIQQLKEEHHPVLKKLKVKIVGNPEAVVYNRVQQAGIEAWIDFVGYVSHREAIEYQNKAGILLLVINRTSNNASIITGKIFEYLAASRPVLCIGPTEGDAADILHTSGHDSIFDYDDVYGIKTYITACYQQYISGQNLSGSETTSIEQYSRKNLTKKMAELLDELTS